MSWLQDTLDDAPLLHIWAQMVAVLTGNIAGGVIALYDRNAQIENQMQSVLVATPFAQRFDRRINDLFF